MHFLAFFLIVAAAKAQKTPENEQILTGILGLNTNKASTTEPGAPSYVNLNEGDCTCVPYHNCDSQGVLRLDGKKDGFGVIDIRFGTGKCSHYLDRCCTNPPEIQSSTLPPIPSTPPPVIPPTQIKCGIRNPQGVEFTITGNKNGEAEFGEFPWMAALLRQNWIPTSNESLIICGGSLIHPQVVLTGAHCLSGMSAGDVKIRAGEWDTQTTKERYPYQERNVRQVIAHKDFINDNLINDIALLVLSEPFELAANVKPVCLPEQNHIYQENECYASGWGKEFFAKGAKPAVILKKIDLPIVDHSKCQDILRTTRLSQYFKLNDSFICAGGAGKDTCTGDGGGPLVCPDRRTPNRYTQAGIVAWGIGCKEEKIPGVYTNVALFRNWIDSQMDALKFDKSSYIV